MKKMIALFLAVILVLGLASCGTKEKPAEGSSGNQMTELEKHTAVQNIAQGTARLDAPADTPKLPKEKTKLSIDEFKEKVEKLKIMYEAGMLTDVEFANAKTELLSSI